MVSFNEVLSEASGRGKAPILIFASEKAMAEELQPLSNALKTFVKFDNRLFKQELLQSELSGNSREKKRSVNGIGSTFSSESKRRNRSSSIDSMATNLASAGDLDEDMRDGAYDLDDQFTADMNGSMAMSLDGAIAGDNHSAELQGELVDVSDSSMQGLAPPSYEDTVRDGSADDALDLLTPAPDQEATSSKPSYVTRSSESPTIGRASLNLANVTLEGGMESNNVNDTGAHKGASIAQGQQQQPEMQERGSIPLITRPASRGSGPMDTSSDSRIE